MATPATAIEISEGPRAGSPRRAGRPVASGHRGLWHGAARLAVFVLETLEMGCGLEGSDAYRLGLAEDGRMRRPVKPR